MPPNSSRKSNVHPTFLSVKRACYKLLHYGTLLQVQRIDSGTRDPSNSFGPSVALRRAGALPLRLVRFPTLRRQPPGHLLQAIRYGFRKSIASHHHSRWTKSNHRDPSSPCCVR